MKRYISLLIIISSLLGLPGCGGIHTNYREIQQLLVVQTLGLDREEGSVRISMAAAAKASGAGPRRMSASGGTVSTAIDRAYDLSYEEDIFFSHVNHILVGQDAAEDMDAFLPQLDRWQVQFVHRLKEHRWGQRVVRFYDPDGHIIEVAEGLEQVAKRFLAQGMTPEQVAQRMDVPIQTLDLN